MKFICSPALLLLSAIIFPAPLPAQEVQDSTAAFKWFDAVVGVENTGLLNGIEYIEQHVSVNDRQKFLGSVLFTRGSVVYNGQPFYDVEMKYNVYDDVLLLRGIGNKPLQLHKSRVREFSINGLHFLNIREDSTAAVNGFHEVILDTDTLTLLKKHTKKRKKYLDRSFTYFEFEEDTPRYAFGYKGVYHPANSRREVINAFPDHAPDIRKFYREERSRAKSNPDLFMTNLSKRLNQLTSSNTLTE